MENWKPPKFGSPVWVGIAANDVSRAAKFYGTVFNWQFRKAPPSPDEKVPEGSETQMMDFNPDVALHGGIVSASEGRGMPGAGPGGTCMYWIVDDLDRIAEVIEKAGGKMVGSTTPIKEGQSGLYRYFEDTEGNVGAVYKFLG